MLFSPFDKAGVHISGFGFLTEQGRHSAEFLCQVERLYAQTEEGSIP
jgi:hypothetical protein